MKFVTINGYTTDLLVSLVEPVRKVIIRLEQRIPNISHLTYRGSRVSPQDTFESIGATNSETMLVVVKNTKWDTEPPATPSHAKTPPHKRAEGHEQVSAFLREILRDDLLEIVDEVLLDEAEEDSVDYDSLLDRLAPVPREKLDLLRSMGFEDTMAKRCMWLAQFDIQAAVALLTEEPTVTLNRKQFKSIKSRLGITKACEENDIAGPQPDPMIVSILQQMGYPEPLARIASQKGFNEFERALTLASMETQVGIQRESLTASLQEAFSCTPIRGDVVRAALHHILHHPHHALRYLQLDDSTHESDLSPEDTAGLTLFLTSLMKITSQKRQHTQQPACNLN